MKTPQANIESFIQDIIARSAGPMLASDMTASSVVRLAEEVANEYVARAERRLGFEDENV